MGLSEGTDFALKTLKFPPRLHHAEFAEHNPLKTVPWFEHQEPWDVRPRAAMSESCAVPMYVADLLRSPLAMKPGVDRDYGAYLNWMAHAEATLMFPQTIVMRYRLFEPERAEVAADDYAHWFNARLRLLNVALKDDRRFLCGDRLTVADICVAVSLFNASEHGMCGAGLIELGHEPLSSRFKPQTRAYLDRMMARPTFIKAIMEPDAK